MRKAHYTATVTVSGDSVTSQSFNVSFTVDAATFTVDANPTTLDFGSKVEGYGTAPDAQTVTIENTGNTSVTLSLPTDTNYSITTLSSLTLAPGGTAVINIRPNTNLAAGTYAPTLTFATDHATSVDVAVTFTVDTAIYTVITTQTSLDFGSIVEGYGTAPDAQTVTIENTGNSSVTLTLPTNANYTVTTSDSLILAPGGTAVINIRPNASLASGTYAPTLTFITNHATSVDVAVTFTVETAVYTVEANQTSLNFGSLVEGYATAPDAQTVTIENTGNASVTLTLPTNTNYTVTTSSSLMLTPGGTAVVSIRPNASLAVGTYAPTLTFTTDHSTSDSVDVTFTVQATPTYTVEANQTSLDFGSIVEGYATAPDAQSVTIKNTGNTSVTLSLPTDTNYTVTTSNSLTLAPGGTAVVSIRPKTNLAVGTYAPTLTFATDHATSDSVDVTFTVNATPTYTIEANQASLDFGSLVEGYATAPDAQTVTIENTGNTSFTLTLPTNTNYTVTTSDSLTLAPSGTAVVSIRPKTNLAVGTYAPTLTFSTDHSTGDSVDVTFTVNAEVYTLYASPNTIDFTSQTVGYTPVASQTVTITNDGNKISTLVQPTATNFTVGSLSRTVLNPGATATFTVQPKDGLPVGVYSETVSVDGTGSATAGTDVSFEVLPVAYDVTGGDQYYQNNPNGLVFTSSENFQNFTGVTVDGVTLTGSQYGAEEGSTIVTLYTSYLNTLPLGSHALRMLFRDGYASANFDVLPVPPLPETGDTTPLTLYIALAALALAALAVLIFVRHKHRAS